MSWMTAPEALALLQVQPQTLYANVSRGKIRAQPDAKDPRRSRYFRDDVLRLAKSRQGRRKTEAVATGAIAWGDPMLPSAISTVIDGRLFYRGHDAIALSDHSGLEDIAALLWQIVPGSLELGRPVAADTSAANANTPESPLTNALLALAARVADDLPTRRRAPAVLREDAARTFTVVADALLGAPRSKRQHHTHHAHHALSQRVGTAWRKPAAEDMIRRALVLLADHELNTSTFATRVTISTGAAMSAAMLTGLATLSGPLHGGAATAVARLVESAQRLGAQAAVRAQLAQGHRFAGFGHPLYPHGDCRAAGLLAHFTTPALHRELASWVEELAGEQPNIDFALSAMTTALKLPAHAPFTLFALARTVGWLAHALEQAAEGRLIRPRAKYVGVMPQRDVA